jgi:hypothetical protein
VHDVGYAVRRFLVNHASHVRDPELVSHGGVPCQPGWIARALAALAARVRQVHPALVARVGRKRLRASSTASYGGWRLL